MRIFEPQCVFVENSLWELLPSFHHVVPGDQTILCAKCFYPLSIRDNPYSFFAGCSSFITIFLTSSPIIQVLPHLPCHPLDLLRSQAFFFHIFSSSCFTFFIATLRHVTKAASCRTCLLLLRPHHLRKSGDGANWRQLVPWYP